MPTYDVVDPRKPQLGSDVSGTADMAKQTGALQKPKLDGLSHSAPFPFPHQATRLRLCGLVLCICVQAMSCQAREARCRRYQSTLTSHGHMHARCRLRARLRASLASLRVRRSCVAQRWPTLPRLPSSSAAARQQPCTVAVGPGLVCYTTKTAFVETTWCLAEISAAIEPCRPKKAAPHSAKLGDGKAGTRRQRNRRAQGQPATPAQGTPRLAAGCCS